MAALAAVVVSVSALPGPVLAQQLPVQQPNVTPPIVTQPNATLPPPQVSLPTLACTTQPLAEEQWNAQPDTNCDGSSRGPWPGKPPAGAVVTNTKGMPGGLGAGAVVAGGLLVTLFALGGSSNTPTMSPSGTSGQ